MDREGFVPLGEPHVGLVGSLAIGGYAAAPAAWVMVALDTVNLQEMEVMGEIDPGIPRGAPEKTPTAIEGAVPSSGIKTTL